MKGRTRPERSRCGGENAGRIYFPSINSTHAGLVAFAGICAAATSVNRVIGQAISSDLIDASVILAWQAPADRAASCVPTDGTIAAEYGCALVAIPTLI